MTSTRISSNRPRCSRSCSRDVASAPDCHPHHAPPATGPPPRHRPLAVRAVQNKRTRVGRRKCIPLEGLPADASACRPGRRRNLDAFNS
jgi:hypothetical protein